MLSTANRKRLALFDADIDAQLASIHATDTLDAAGAVSLLTYHTKLAVSGTMALTLAAPTVVGQKKRISCQSAASTPAATLTIADPDDTTGSVCASTFFFDTVGQAIELEATSALKWRCTRVQRAGVTIPVIGTTVLTGKNLYALYSCSVTGTVVSATTKGIPNGSAVGEVCHVGCSTAASTPVGSITLTGISPANGTVVDIQAIGATTDMVSLMWTGTAWLVFQNIGCTLA